MTPACEFVYAQSMMVVAGGGRMDYLEIGVQEGDSMAAVLRNEGVHFAVGIDTWGEDSGGTGRGNADHIPKRFHDDMFRLMVITADSHHVLPGLRHYFDLIFIDGDHSLEGCLSDLNGCRHLLRRDNPRARILVDDLDHPKHSYLHALAEKWASENGFTFKFHPIGYGIAELGISSEPASQSSELAQPQQA